MQRTRKTAAALAVIATIFAAAPAFADPGPKGPHGPREEGAMGDGPMRWMMDALKLTPDQRGKVETLRARSQEQTKGMREELGKKRRELFELIRQPKATREQAVAKQREIDTLQNRLAEARLAAWFDTRAVLTPEQLAQLEKLGPGKGGWKGRRERKGDR